jgi:FkbM family methyltransferase
MTTPSQQNFLSKFLIENNIKNILDIGANVGLFSNVCRSVISDANIYMVEANPECEKFLETMGNKYYIAALSDTNKEITFYINKNNPVCTGASYYKEKGSAYIDAKEIKMKTDLLDNILFEENIIFDLIKIDVQGSELDVICGGKKTISQSSFVLCECPYTENDSIPEYNTGGCDFEQIIKLMKEYGFLNYKIIEELKVAHNDENWNCGDIVALDVLFYK